MDTLGHDLRYAMRTLFRSPGFTTIAVLTLALGIGATTAIFSAVNGVLLRPLPYPDPERIVRVFEIETSHHNRLSDPNFEDVYERSRSFRALAQFQSGVVSVSGGSEPTRARIAFVSREFFEVMGALPVIGRGFLPEEQQLGAAPAVILAHGYWLRYFGGDVDLAGITLRIDDQQHAVVGVMPPGFDYPDGAEVLVPRELWGTSARTAHNYEAVGRLADGVPLGRATADVRAIARQLREVHGDGTNMTDAALVPLHESTVGQARPALLLLFAGAALLLVIACANVVNLLLARASARQRELAVRVALGGGRVRLARVFLTESLLLSLAGGALGVLLAAWGMDLLLALGVDGFPRMHEIRLDGGVLVFALAVSMLAAAVLGLMTAWRATGGNVRGALASGSRGATGGRASERVRGALVVSQIGLTMILLVAAGLLGRSFLRLLDIDPGFRTEGAVVMDIAVPRAPEAADRRARSNFLQQLIERLSTIPGIEEVGGTNAVPLGGGGFNGTFLVLNHPGETSDGQDFSAFWRDPERTGQAEFRVASEGYFRAMAIPLVRGRLPGPADGPDAPHVAVINESLAATRWPGEDPLGKFIYFGNMDGDPRAFTIVGIVGDVHESSLEAEPKSMFYGYYRQRPAYGVDFSLVLYGARDAAPLVSAARQIVTELDPRIPPSFRTLEQVYAGSLAKRRFNFLLLGTFGTSALALALMGVYGVISFAVTQRTREIGIRMALGARTGSVLRLVVRRGLVLAAIGIVFGAAGALAATRLLTSFLFGVTTTDTVTFVAVPLLLVGAALVAAYLPARRAAQVDPMIALRAE